MQPAFMRLSAQAPHSNVLMAAEKGSLKAPGSSFVLPCTALVSWHSLVLFSFLSLFSLFLNFHGKQNQIYKSQKLKDPQLESSESSSPHLNRRRCRGCGGRLPEIPSSFTQQPTSWLCKSELHPLRCRVAAGAAIT